MLYELDTLSCPLLAVQDTATRAHRWIAEATSGELLGSWRSELGTLGRVLILRGFETAEALWAERERALMSTSPFASGKDVSALSMKAYAPFDFLPAISPRAMGGVYEIRTYRLHPGGLAPTIAAWRTAVAPAHRYTKHLVSNMYGIDGAPRIMHIWGFESLEQRAALRSEHYAAGLWPPPGGPQQILEATSTIALPNDASPLR